jgi:hypothetical protein
MPVIISGVKYKVLNNKHDQIFSSVYVIKTNNNIAFTEPLERETEKGNQGNSLRTCVTCRAYVI